MLFQKFFLAGNIAAVALGKNVLAHGFHRFAGNNAGADSRLDGNFKKLARNVFFQPLGDLARAGIGLVLVNDKGKCVHLFAVEQKIQLDQFARQISFQLVVQRSIAAGAAFQRVEKVVNDLVQRQVVVKFHARGIQIFHIDKHAAAILTKVHQPAHVFGRGNDVGLDHRLVSGFDQVGGGKVGGVVNAQRFAAFDFNFINYAGRGGDQVKIELAFQPFLYNFHVQKAEESAAKAEAERHRGFRLESERGVVQAELFQSVAQISVAGAVGGVNTGVHHGLNGLEAGQGRGAGSGRKRDRIAHARIAHAFDGGGQIAHLARGKGSALGKSERLHGANLNNVKLGAGTPKANAVSRAQGSVHYANIDHHAQIAVVVGIKDQRFQRGVLVALGRGNIAHHGFQHVCHVLPSFG